MAFYFPTPLKVGWSQDDIMEEPLHENYPRNKRNNQTHACLGEEATGQNKRSSSNG